MATKRMFSNNVIDSDLFLELSPMAQLLYFHCGMKTDDDGFVAGARRIARIIGATEDEFSELTGAGFMIEFTGNKVFLMAHHRMNNDLKNDRHHDTVYQTEFSQVEETDKVYKLKSSGNNTDTSCNQNVSNPDTEHSVTNPIVTHENVTHPIVNVEEGSDEGGNTLFVDPIALKSMTDKAGINRQIVENAIADIGALKTYQAFKDWEKNDKPDTNKFSKYVLERVS